MRLIGLYYYEVQPSAWRIREQVHNRTRMAGSSHDPHSSHPPSLDPQALKMLKRNEADDMWLTLPGCGLQDAQVQKIAEGLKSATNLISIDLSDNRITDKGECSVQGGC